MQLRKTLALLTIAVLFVGLTSAWGQTTQPVGDDTDLTPVQPTDTPENGQDGQDGTPAEQADGNGAGTSTQPGNQQNQGGDPGLLNPQTMFLFVLFGAIILMYVWMGRSRKKQQKKRQEMIESLGKGDKIVTIGGIVGTVIEAKKDEVVVKVDETNNVRMHFARWSVRGVGPEAKEEDQNQ